MLSIQAEKRTTFGKRLEALRAQGKLPVVMYGPKESNGSYIVDAKEFTKVWHEAGESSIVSFHVDGEEKDVLIHDVALDPITDKPVHADLYAIEKGKLLRVRVPLEFTGVAPAVKTLAGILVKVLHEVEVEALPRALPHDLTVDVSVLATFEDRVLVKDIALPEGVTITEPEASEVVALVTAPKEEKEEDSVPVDLSKIEVQERGKKPEEAEGEAAPEDK